MEELIYTEVEYRKDKDGFDEKWVYVPALDEWMTEDSFYFEKAMYGESMEEAEEYYHEESNDDIYPDEEEDLYEEDEYPDSEEIDYSNMTREEAMEEYRRTGINHSEHDLNDWDEINRRLGYRFQDMFKK